MERASAETGRVVTGSQVSRRRPPFSRSALGAPKSAWFLSLRERMPFAYARMLNMMYAQAKAPSAAARRTQWGRGNAILMRATHAVRSLLLHNISRR